MNTQRTKKKGNIGNVAVATEMCFCGNPLDERGLCCEECSKDLDYRISMQVVKENMVATYIDRLTKSGEIRTIPAFIHFDEYLETLRELDGLGPGGKCSICGSNFIFSGHNPDPVIPDIDARCCTRCNYEVVMQNRLPMLFNR